MQDVSTITRMLYFNINATRIIPMYKPIEMADDKDDDDDITGANLII